MDATTLGQWVGIALAVAAGIAAYRKAPSERNLTNAQAESLANEAANRIIDQLQEELERAHAYADRLKAECAERCSRLEKDLSEVRADLFDERQHVEMLKGRIARQEHELNQHRRET